MPTLEKQQTVTEFAQQAKACKGIVITSFNALKTTEFNELRAKLRPLNCEYRVVKNSLTRLALKNAGMEGLAAVLEGPTAVLFEHEDAVIATKTIFEYAKAHENVKIRGGFFEGSVVTGENLKEIANLPSREVLLSKLLGTLQAPAVNLASVLQAPLRDLVTVLNAVSEKTT